MEYMLSFITYLYFKLPYVEPLKYGNESKSSHLLNTLKTILFTSHWTKGKIYLVLLLILSIFLWYLIRLKLFWEFLAKI